MIPLDVRRFFELRILYCPRLHTPAEAPQLFTVRAQGSVDQHVGPQVASRKNTTAQ